MDATITRPPKPDGRSRCRRRRRRREFAKPMVENERMVGVELLIAYKGLPKQQSYSFFLEHLKRLPHPPLAFPISAVYNLIIPIRVSEGKHYVSSLHEFPFFCALSLSMNNASDGFFFNILKNLRNASELAKRCNIIDAGSAAAIWVLRDYYMRHFISHNMDKLLNSELFKLLCAATNELLLSGELSHGLISRKRQFSIELPDAYSY